MTDRKPFHEFASIFPMPSSKILSELGERIAKGGQREAIVLLGGEILDGRCRETACRDKGIEPRYREFGSRKEDGTDPLEFVIDTNLHRRHLTDGEMAMAAARYATAKRGCNQFSGRVHPPGESTEAPLNDKKTRQEAAERFGVGTSTVDRAKRILDSGVPELHEAVSSGEVTVSDADNVAKADPEAQRQAVKDVREGKAKTATESAGKQTQAKPARRKNSHDDEGIIVQIANLRRATTLRAKTRGKGKAYVDCVDALDAYQRAFDRWRLATN